MEKRTRHTSIEVYGRIKAEGLLSKRRWQVYDILFQYGPLTGAQVAKRMRDFYGVGGFSESVRNRLTELRDMGCVAEVGEMRDPYTRNHVIVWDVNDQIPTALPHREKSIDSFSYRKALEDLSGELKQFWLFPPKEVLEAIARVKRRAA